MISQVALETDQQIRSPLWLLLLLSLLLLQLHLLRFYVSAAMFVCVYVSVVLSFVAPR